MSVLVLIGLRKQSNAVKSEVMPKRSCSVAYNNIRRYQAAAKMQSERDAIPLAEIGNNCQWPPSLYVLNAALIAKPHAIEQLTADVLGSNTDVANIRESHLKEKHMDRCVSIEGYTIIRRDQRRRRRGGVAVYARHHLRPTERVFPGAFDTFEMLCVEMNSGDNIIMIGALYHPPSPIYDTAALCEYIELCVDSISRKKPSAIIIIAGDLNLLSEDVLIARTRLISIVEQPRQEMNGLDRINVSDLCYDGVKVITSADMIDFNSAFSAAMYNKY